MMKFLISSVSAAALMAASSIAIAQDKGTAGGSGSAGGAPAARDFGGGSPGGRAPAGAPGAQTDRDGPRMAPSAEKSEPAAEETGRGAEDGAKPRANERAPKDGQANDLKKDAAKDGKNAGNASTGAGSGEEGKASPGNAADDRRLESKSAEPKQGGAHVTLNSDQRSRVNTAFKGHKGSAGANVSVDVRVGVRLPRSIALVAIPSDVIVVVPEWRLYKYIVVGDTVCIVDPDTFEIIDVIVLT